MLENCSLEEKSQVNRICSISQDNRMYNCVGGEEVKSVNN